MCTVFDLIDCFYTGQSLLPYKRILTYRSCVHYCVSIFVFHVTLILLVLLINMFIFLVMSIICDFILFMCAHAKPHLPQVIVRQNLSALYSMLWQVTISNDRFKNLEMDLFLVFCLFVNMCYVNYGVFLKKISVRLLSMCVIRKCQHCILWAILLVHWCVYELT